MKLKVSIHGWGNETVVTKIPKATWKYIKENFKGKDKAYEYVQAAEEGKVPAEYLIGEGLAGGLADEGEYHEYGPSIAGSYITVENADTGDVLVDSKPCTDFSDEDPDFIEHIDLKRGEHASFYRSSEKGSWSVWEIDIPGKRFNKKKLRIPYNTLWFNDEATTVITGLKYGDEEYEMNTDDLCTDGKCTDMLFI